MLRFYFLRINVHMSPSTASIKNSCANRIIAQGANPNETDANGETPPHMKPVAIPTPSTPTRQMPLHPVACQGHLEIAKRLVQQGALVDRKNRIGESPKKVALRYNHLNVAHFLATKSPKRIRALVPPTHSQTIHLLRGDLLRYQKNWKEAERVYQNLFNWAEEKEDLPLQISSLKKLGDVMLESNRHIEAAHYYNSALALRQNEPQPHLLERLERTERSYVQNIAEFDTNPSAISTTKIAAKRTALSQMREHAIKALGRSTPASKIMKKLTAATRTITQELLQECFQALPPPPCSYAIVAIGAMSKEEMALYSDLKIAILVKENTPIVRKYFATFIHLLELKMINLGETQCPILQEKKKSATPKGFTLNRIFSPLRRTELLGTPKKIAIIQKENSDIILSSILKTVTLLDGDDFLLKQYEKTITNKTKILYLLKEDLTDFAPQLERKNTAEEWIDLRNLYRFPSEAIEKLCSYYQITGKNMWQRLETLKKKKVFGEEGHQNLCQAMELIHGIRLRSHAYCCEEQEVVHHPAIASSPKGFYELNAQDLTHLSTIYQVLLPFYQALMAFCQGNKKILNSNRFYHENSAVKILPSPSKKGNCPSPLHVAAGQGRLEMVQTLIREGKDLGAKNHIGNTAKREALRGGHLQIAKLLSEKRNRGKTKFLPLTHPQREALWQGDLAGEQNQIEKALPHYQKALEAGKKTNDILLQIACLKKIGNSWLVKKEYATAASYYNTTLALLEKTSGHSSQKQKLLQHLCTVETQCANVPHMKSFLSIEQKRTKLLQMRENAKKSLQTQMSASTILEKITEEAKHLTQTLLSECLQGLGPPPCKYAILALGSMGRREMSLYSDVELAILLEENTEQNRNYFLQFTQLLQIKIINLGETRAEILPEEESATIEGFHLDMMNPLYVEELLNTPEEMAAIQEQSDPILPNLLRMGSFLMGNRFLVARYEQSISEVWGNTTNRQMKALTLLQKDLKAFDPQLTQKLTKEATEESTFAFNIKGELYRLPSEVINKLCLYYGIWEKNTWDRLNKLKEKYIVSKEGHRNLCNAMEAITRLRLRTHAYYGMENEDVYHRSKKSSEKSFTLNDTDIQTLVNIYKVLLPLYETLQLFCANSGDADYLRENPFCDQGRTAEGALCERWGKYGKAEQYYREAIGINPEDREALMGLGNSFARTSQYKEATELYEQILASLQKEEKPSRLPIANVLDRLGEIQCALSQHKKAMETYYQPALSIRKQDLGEKHIEVAQSLHHLASASRALHKREDAISLYNEILSIYTLAYGTYASPVIQTLNDLGDTWNEHSNYQAAKESYEQALTIARTMYERNPSEETKKLYKRTKGLFKEMVAIQRVIAENKVLRETMQLLLRNDPREMRLSLSSKNIDSKGFEIFVKALEQNKTLKELDFCYNEMRNTRVEILATGLKYNHFLTQLNLTGNHISTPGLQALAEMIREHPSLRHINLTSNQIGNAKVAVGKTIPNKASPLKDPLLEGSIDDPGVSSLAHALSTNKSLQVINLSWNQIGDAEAAMLIKGLANNTTLLQLNLTGNRIDDKQALARQEPRFTF